MRKVVALLAAVLVVALVGCGDDGAEPGAPERATLVLDFQPNAVHAGIYTALANHEYTDEGVDLDVQEPSSSTDAPKLLAAGRAQFAILDIHDLGIARERGLDVVGVMPIVQRPLASVISAGDIGRPADLEGRTTGVTGLPSDDAVLDSVVAGDGGQPGQVDRVTIGFNAVAALAAGKVDAVTAFWNAEGVALERRGVPTHVFRVDDFGAPRYPELVLCTSGEELKSDPELVNAVRKATEDGYTRTIADPGAALDDLVSGVNGLDRAEQRAQLGALMKAHAFEPAGSFDQAALNAWAGWDFEHGLVKMQPDVAATFPDLED
jgi:NitT/TauT family transport system substrate-binding protein/putative hydroxymethylpyrimidine transport system substrate-binding protein